ncbi:hypothetical protein DFH06DRAFT_1193927 [Mycena polygramma]|nr:hypothetical protein DFH06DRAFT_1193927 [Mycena polygramma]
MSAATSSPCPTKQNDSQSEPAGSQLNSEAGKLFKAGDYTGAAEHYERAIAENDSVATYFCNLAAAYLKLERWHAAQEAGRRALLLEPRSFKARYRRAMARKGLKLIPQALVDIAGLLTADPGNAQAKAEFTVLAGIHQRAGGGALEPNEVLAADFPHAYGSPSNPPLRNSDDPHQMSRPFFYKVDADEAPGYAAIRPGVVVSACITCKETKDKKDLKTCRKCSQANYCSVECQRADWPTHKRTCGVAPDYGRVTIKIGRNIHHHQFFQLHLILYAVRAMGPPNLPSGKHDFLLMVVVDMVPIPNSQPPRKRIAVTNILPVPLCIVPREMVDIHRAVVAGTLPHVYLHAIWITTSGVYRRGEEEPGRVGVIAVVPFIMKSIGNPTFSLDLYSHSYGCFRRVTPDLDFLFASINDELRMDTANHYRLQA